MKQPLSYQTLPCSCWVTSVINGLLCLHGDKNKIPGLVLRLLHSVLTDEGVDSGGKAKADWEIVLEAVALKCNLSIKSYQKEAVEGQLEKIDFTSSVAICDILAGTHSILLNGKENEWYYAFDPDWDQVKRNIKKQQNKYEIFPSLNNDKQGRVNVKINKNHLLNQRATKNSFFAMGAVSERNITIIKKNG